MSNHHTDVNLECSRHSRSNVHAAIKAPWWYKGQMVEEGVGDQKKTKERARAG